MSTEQGSKTPSNALLRATAARRRAAGFLAWASRPAPRPDSEWVIGHEDAALVANELARVRTALETIVRTSKLGGAVEIARAALNKSITDTSQSPSQTGGDG